MNKLDFSNMSVTVASAPTVLMMTLLAFGVGIFIYWVYRMNYRGVMYSASFGMTLILMTLITAPVVMCIRESVALSMGMVGALSIVRFRTAVKDPLDTAYMFWALTMGILLGAGQYFLAILAAVLIAAGIFLMARFGFRGADCYLLVVRAERGAERDVARALTSKAVRKQRLKSQTAQAQRFEMVYEIRTEKGDQLLANLNSIDGMIEATLVSYQGETT
ncbi:MAG: DUF4956 domain-containing protein [Christensenellales bacterium]|jgi:uncharacterized membrane protein YhiD involved in acid resistance